MGKGSDTGNAGPGNHPDRRAFPEQRLQAETGIPIPAVGIQDPERCSATRRTGPAAGNDDLDGLPDDIPSQTDPRAAGELQANARPLPDRGGNRAGEPRWFKDKQGDPGPPGQRGESAEPIGKARSTLRPSGQIHDQQVNGPSGQERPGDGKALIRAGRRDHHEPLGLDATGNGLHRIEGIREIQPGHDRPTGLRFSRKPERDGGPSARQITSKCHAHPARQAAGPEDRVQG